MTDSRPSRENEVFIKKLQKVGIVGSKKFSPVEDAISRYETEVSCNKGISEKRHAQISREIKELREEFAKAKRDTFALVYQVIKTLNEEEKD